MSSPTAFAASAGGAYSVNVTATHSNSPYNVSSDSAFFAITSGASGTGSAADKIFPFARQPGATAVTSDWKGDGQMKVGFYLNGSWDGIATDKFVGFGNPGVQPIVGRW